MAARPLPGGRTDDAMLLLERCYACRREDLLPLRCASCRHLFCSEHSAPEHHACPHQGQDVLVPLCPLCDTPPPGWRREHTSGMTQKVLERHWHAPSEALGGCPALVGRRTAQPSCALPRCSRRGAPLIECPQCHASFCVPHRAPSQHECPASRAPSSTHIAWRTVTPRPALAPPHEARTPPPSNNKIPVPRAPAPRPPTAAMARRAAQERASAIRAMQARHERGLLTDTEKYVLAQYMAEGAASTAPPSTDRCLVQ